MKLQWIPKIGFAVALGLSPLTLTGLTGCEEGDAENAGEEVDDALEDTGDALDDAKDDVEEGVNDAGRAVEDATD